MGRKEIKLKGKTIGDNEPVYIIAEGGVTNWGELALAKKQVDAAVAAGCDAIKFQAQTTEELVSKKVDSYWFDRMKYKELSHDELGQLWEYCAQQNIQCCVTAHTDIDLDFVDRGLQAPFFKVGSGESMNYKFLKNVGSRGKPVIMSLGMHLTEEEIKKSVQTLEDAGCRDIILLHCNTVYPTPPAIDYLGMIGRLKGIFDYPIGYSDHTVGWHIPLAAVAVGAAVLEKHISFDLQDKRSLDCPGSCTPETLKIMVKEIREVEAALREPAAFRHDAIMAGRQWARQSIVAKFAIEEGSEITEATLSFKRPGRGLDPNDAIKIINKKAARNIAKDELITENNVK